MNRLHTVRTLKRSETGTALPLALMGLLMISVLGFTLVALGMTEVNIATNWRAYNTAFYAADAGLENGATRLRSLLQNGSSPTAKDLATITAPPPSDPKLKFSTYSVTWANPSPPANPTGSYQTTFTSGPFTGLFGIVTDYRVTSQVTGAGGTQANLTQIVKYAQIPLFQFGIFYGQGVDLEFQPGSAMTFNGRVHANSNIGMGTRASLQFQSLITSAGAIRRTTKNQPGSIPFANDPTIADASGTYHNLNFDHDYQPGFTKKWASPTDFANYAKSVFGTGGKPSTVQDSAMGVGQITLPIPGLFTNPSNPDVVTHQLIEMPQASDSPELKAAKLYSQADIRIVDGVATDRNGNSVTLPASAVTTTSFYDRREQKTETITQVDIAKLQQVAAGVVVPANGILYVGSTKGPGNAVRLVNGASLPSQGLTVVSQNPVYIQGDYNTAATAPGGTHPPAAVLADAVTVLSNNWAPNNSDSKGSQPQSTRPATPTTVNAAIATGPDKESSATYDNGNLVNVIRFLEDWSGKAFTYSGSIVAMWHSQQATGAFCCGGANTFYEPPIRNWSYDTLFNTKVPPGTPSAVILFKGPWSQS